MGIQIKRYKNGKYGLWSTIVDAYITEPRQLSRDEAVTVLVDRARESFERDAREIRATFPNGYCDKDGDGLGIITNDNCMSRGDFAGQELEAIRTAHAQQDGEGGLT